MCAHLSILTPAAKHDPVFSTFEDTFDVMHWHHDMPGCPKDAQILAESAGCPNQAFRWGDRVYGLQCHFETTQQRAKALIDRFPTDLSGDGNHYIQSAEDMLKADFTDMNQKLIKLLDHLT